MKKNIGLYLSTLILFISALPLEAQDEPCCNNLKATISALYWKAQEEGLDYAIKNKNGTTYCTDGEVDRVDFDWDWGFKLGLGYYFPCRCFDFDVLWTRFHSKGSDSTSAEFPDALFPIWTNPNTNFTNLSHSKACINLDLDTIDLQLSSLFSPNCFLSLRPRAGLFVALIDQKFNINAGDGDSLGTPTLVLDDDIDMKNDFWGIGPKLGVDTIWTLGCGFSFIANGDLAITYGCFNIHQTENVLFEETVPPTTYFKIKDDPYYHSLVNLALLIGLRWNTKCFCKYDFSFEAAWEHLYFFKLNQLMRFTTDANPGINVGIQGDLSIQGLTLTTRLTF